MPNATTVSSVTAWSAFYTAPPHLQWLCRDFIALFMLFAASGDQTLMLMYVSTSVVPLPTTSWIGGTLSGANSFQVIQTKVPVWSRLLVGNLELTPEWG